MLYRVTRNAWIAGIYCDEGAIVEFTEKQAKYGLLSGLLKPHAELVEPTKSLPMVTPRPSRKRAVISSLDGYSI